MKKEILMGAIALLISVGVAAQTTEPVQTKTKKQLRIEAKQQAKLQKQDSERRPDHDTGLRLRPGHRRRFR
ncbi:MAG: hypothetical protein MZV63_68085 [Marinilabiliales bacterium]|nr:hypothetical protein [Marinilabiliales bacterium]